MGSKGYRARIILADDHLAVAESVRAMLNEQFEVVTIVSSGEDLIKASRTFAADVLLVDIQMPRMTGLEAARTILKENPQARIVFLSSYSEAELVMEAFAMGASGYVLKSDASSDLTTAIRKALDGRCHVCASVRKNPRVPDEIRAACA